MIATRSSKYCHKRFIASIQSNKKLSHEFFRLIKMNIFTQKSNPITGSLEWEVQKEDYDFHQEIARSAFADMLHDTERNQKYESALKIAIEQMHKAGKKANVLDIGTGTGLLSIMAARNGADTITACEAFKPMSECALKVIKKNGMCDKISVIPKRSTEMTVGESGDMQTKANILVTEVFDTELIGEGAIGTFSHAHKYLLEEDCIVVPDSAVIYAQIVECPTLQKWNRLSDLSDEELNIVLKTPPKIKTCAGSAAVHDIQLSQLSRDSFRPLSEAIPVLYYDWSGKSPIDKNKVVKQDVTPLDSGIAQMVFMWWELNMDTQGKIVINCAPWWHHPDTNLSSEHPQDTIPWRDHWMQAVYYFPKDLAVVKDTEVTLISAQDEYSLWFYIENKNFEIKRFERPICECGVHMALSRTQVSYLNDGKRSKIYIRSIKETIDNNSVVLNLNGASLLGLVAAKLGAKIVYTLESNRIMLNILHDYIKENNIENVKLLNDTSEIDLTVVTHIICDPNFANAILPWDNLRMAYLLYKLKPALREDVVCLPQACTFWAMPVQFIDLHKIRQPLKTCEGIEMGDFDALIEDSRLISDDELEAQPLWEYPCICRGEPKQLVHIDFDKILQTYTEEGKVLFSDCGVRSGDVVNGWAVWAAWRAGASWLGGGCELAPRPGQRLSWDPHTRQAVKILKENKIVQEDTFWTFNVSCDLEKGAFNLKLGFNE